MKTTRKQFTAEERLAAVLRTQTEPVQKIADDIGVHQTTLRGWMASHGKRPAGKSIYPLEKRQAVARRIVAGESGSDIARELHIKPHLVYGWHHSYIKHQAKTTTGNNGHATHEQTALPQPASVLNFCPHCGMPLASVALAVSAITALNQSKS